MLNQHILEGDLLADGTSRHIYYHRDEEADANNEPLRIGRRRWLLRDKSRHVCATRVGRKIEANLHFGGRGRINLDAGLIQVNPRLQGGEVRYVYVRARFNQLPASGQRLGEIGYGQIELQRA